MSPRLQLTSVTIGATDPGALAQFYARLLDTEVVHADPARPGHPLEDGWAQLRAVRCGLSAALLYPCSTAVPGEADQGTVAQH